ncbi:MAG: hypothetical protein JXB88_09225 [Spirochaetales bacterium]|nr:hypothetical protein [Spirochaetales bacterium]
MKQYIILLILMVYTLPVFPQDYTVTVEGIGPPGITVKYSGDFEGTGEVPFIIGPYPAPFTVYIEPTTLEIEKASGMGYYLAGFPGESGNEVVAMAELTTEESEVTKSLIYLDYDGPTTTPAPTPLTTTGPVTRGYIRGVITDMESGAGIEGATVIIYNPNTGIEEFTLTTSSDGSYDTGYFMSTNIKISNWYIEVQKDGYYTGERYLYCWTCSGNIELTSLSGGSPQPLPSFSPTPPPGPTSTPVNKALWNPLTLITRPDIEITRDGEVVVPYFFQTPCVRVVNWGTPVKNGNTITINPFFVYWNGSEFKPNYYLKHAYFIEGVKANEEYTFLFESWDASSFEVNKYLMTPAPTPSDAEVYLNPSLAMAIITENGQTTARLTSLFFINDYIDVMYEITEKGPVNQAGNTFVLSPHIIKYQDNTSTDIDTSTYDYSLGDLNPGTYTVEVYSSDNLVLTKDFIIYPASTPAPPVSKISGHVDGTTKLFLYGTDYRIIQPDSYGDYQINDLSQDGYYVIRPIYIPNQPESVFLAPENNGTVSGYFEFALQVSPDVRDCEYNPSLLTFDGVYSDFTGQNFTITALSDVKTVVHHVDYYIDGQSVYKDTTCAYDTFTYLFYYDTALLTNGYHTLKAVIYSLDEPLEKEIRFQVTGGQTVFLGDVNNDNTVDIIDALLTAQYYVGLEPPGFNPDNADVNCDAKIDILDALLIAQYYVGLISEFC